MGTKTIYVLLAAAVVCGCGEKKSPGTVAPVKVMTMTVGEAPAEEGQAYSGTVEEESGSTLSFAASGTVKSINVSEGQFVRKGQLVGVVDAVSARNAHDAALAAKEQAFDARNRMRMLHDAGSLPEIKWVEAQTQVRQAEAAEQIARKGLADTKLYAPYAGFITKKYIEAGASAAPGTAVVELVRIDRVKVKVSVPEEEVSAIGVGTPLRVSVAALGGRTFDARVTERNVSADPLSRSYEVKAEVANPRHELLPGMIAEVVARGKAAAPEAASVALPAGIVQLSSDNRTFVWTVSGGKARKTFIDIAGNAGDKVLVSGGLRSGDRVITQGAQKVSSGMAVTE